MKRLLVPAVVLLIVAAGGLAVTRERWWPRPNLAQGGLDLGRLADQSRRDRLNLLLVTLDTTRADRLGAYGRPAAAATPAFDRLAREGVLFDRAMTSAPLTLPAHATMFTGQYPPVHGVRDNGGFFLGPEATTLAERLRTRGFRTGAFVGAFVLDAKWGLDQGFEHYADDFDLSKVQGQGVSLGSVQRRAAEVVELALPWLESVADQRYFAWLHFYDAHAPYDPPEPFASQYARAPYNGEVAYADAQLGRVVSFLERRGQLDHTVVVVVGDHGESLGEHGEGTHGFFVYETATHVPLAIRAPFARTTGRRVSSLVRTVDLLPTVLDLLGEPPADAGPGQSLVPLMTGDSQDLAVDGYAEAMYPLHHYGWSALRAFRLGRYKLIDAPRPELFDLEQDPGETTNLFEQQAAVGERLRTALRGMEASFARDTPAAPAAAAVDPETREQLRSLGYVASFVATVEDDAVVRADPKDKIALFNLMSEARDVDKDETGGADRAIGLLKQVVADDPQVIDAWLSLGNVYFRESKFEEAIAHFSRALALKPDYDLPLINMANAYRALGRDAEALAGYEHYLRVDPKNAWVHYQAGEIHLDGGNVDRAAAYFRQSLALDETVAPARVALGVVAFTRGDATTADREIRQALATRPDVRLAHYNLGVIAEARGDMAAAEAAYRRELELHADAYKAVFNLARILQQRGDAAAALPLFERAVVINQRFAEGHLYLAQARLAAGHTAGAAEAARTGLELAPASDTAPLGHFVLADVAMRAGRLDEAERELERGRALEQRQGAARPPSRR
jgi:arylsulfatase A-like enzyme/Tfp pilus assembly protein PilF